MNEIESFKLENMKFSDFLMKSSGAYFDKKVFLRNLGVFSILILSVLFLYVFDFSTMKTIYSGVRIEADDSDGIIYDENSFTTALFVATVFLILNYTFFTTFIFKEYKSTIINLKKTFIISDLICKVVTVCLMFIEFRYRYNDLNIFFGGIFIGSFFGAFVSFFLVGWFTDDDTYGFNKGRSFFLCKIYSSEDKIQSLHIIEKLNYEDIIKNLTEYKLSPEKNVNNKATKYLSFLN